MNLFKKALIAVLGLGLVVAPSATRQAEEVKAATTWSVTFNLDLSEPAGWNPAAKSPALYMWGTSVSTPWPGIAMEKVEGNNYTLTHEFSASAKVTGLILTFDQGGSTKQSTDTTSFGGASSISSVNDGEIYNVKFNNDWTDGKFRCTVTTAEKSTITYHHDGNTTKQDVLKGSDFDSKFIEKEGFRLEGWYTDSALTKKFEKGTAVTSNIDLYAKYVEAEDYNVYFKDNGTLGSTVYAYMYRDTLDGGYNEAWPGTALTKDANGYWTAAIDASQSYSKIIFNGGEGKSQTANLELTNEDSLYTIGAKDSEGKYTATAESLAAGRAANLSVRYQENGTSLRLISTLGAAGDESFSIDSYTNVGFKFYNGIKEKEVTAGYVYTSVVADGEPISAAAYDAQYFFVTTFNNVPEGTSLTVTPYATLANGFVYYGTPVTVTVSY